MAGLKRVPHIATVANAENLIELCIKTAVKLSYWAEHDDFDAMRHELAHAYMLEKAIINKLSTQQVR
jgi:hypothetical protein